MLFRSKSTLNSKASSGIYVGAANLRITGEKGSLTINAYKGKVSIYVKEDLTIAGGCSVEAKTTIWAENTISINKASVHVTEQNSPAFLAKNGIKLMDCDVVFPEDGVSQQQVENDNYYYYTFVKDGNFCKEVKIGIHLAEAGGNIGR